MIATVAESKNQSRRSLRAQESARTSKGRRATRPFQRLLTMTAATGLLATFALPSYGFSPDITAAAGLTRDGELANNASLVQGLTIATARAVEFTRGDFQPAAASEFEVRASASIRYSGPRAADYLANPRFTAINSANLMKAAAELVGTPYVYGGQTPGGIDCSGYVLFVYAQFGISLPHSVYQQARMAVKIPESEAVPGDIVVFNDFSHNGIYAGNGNFYHAPQPGDRVKLAPIFTDRYHIIRLADIEN